MSAPFEDVSGRRQPILPFLAQHQCEKGAEHGAADGVVIFVNDRRWRDIAVRKNRRRLITPRPLNRLGIEKQDKIARLWHYTNFKIPAPFSKINGLYPARLR